MRAVLVFAVLLLLTGCGLFARLDAPPPLPLVQADYQRCAIVSQGPITRRDGYNADPYRNRGGNA